MQKQHLFKPDHPAASSSAAKAAALGSDSFSPSKWSDYFDSSRIVTIPGTENRFKVYESGEVMANRPHIVLHHGGGHSALSWALCARALRKASKSMYSVMAYDCRGHGRTVTDNDSDLSLETLSNDLVTLLKAMYGEKLPQIFLVGHSMGGAIAVHVASQKMIKVQGLIVLDVVEGTAMEAVTNSSMVDFLRRRPPFFKSFREAIQWSISMDIILNLESAKVSIPPQLKRIQNPLKPLSQEELDNDTGEGGPGIEYTWKTDLFASEQYWKAWFSGMSSKFLTSPAAKLLILAGTDRLDKDLTIGQMQGKFQMKILPACGHIVQEDAPEKVAEAMVEFIDRNQPLDLAAIRSKNPPPQRTF